MILDLEHADVAGGLDADVCVVGAGAVGLVLAIVLAERGVDVLLVEGGGEDAEGASQALQEGRSVGHPFENIAVGRYRVLGGTTTQWAGQLVPFDASVIEARPWLGHAAWPLEPDVLQHYVAAAYRRLGLDDVLLDDAEIWRRLGQGLPEFGSDLDVVISRWVKTTNFARMFRRQLRTNVLPRALVHANVVSMELSPERDRVQAVRARSLGGKDVQVRARRFVLANGTLEVVRLLKHPLTDGSFGPWSESRWLGSPFIDHLDAPAGAVTVLDYKRFHDHFDPIYLSGHKYYPRIRLAPELQRSKGLVDVAAEFHYHTRDTEHLAYLKNLAGTLRGRRSEGTSWWALPKHLAGLTTDAGPMVWRRILERRSFKPKDAEVTLAFACEQLPLTRSHIDLADDRDALGMRRVCVDWQIDGRELRSMKVFATAIKQALESRGLAFVDIDPRLLDEDPAFVSAIHDGIHHMGATRIGRDPGDGFVDENLKVFDAQNLHLLGATVFPSTGFANPTLTAIALALRLGDYLTAHS